MKSFLWWTKNKKEPSLLPKEEEKTSDFLSLDEFKKAELRVGRVLAAERVPNSSKLLKLLVGLGDEERQILSGIGGKYQPEDVLNKRIVIIANLAPRKMMGLESRGMMLAANGDGGPVFLTTEEEVPDGSSVQ